MKKETSQVLTVYAILLLMLSAGGRATPPPQTGGPLPEAYTERTDRDPKAFSLEPALLELEAIQKNRAAAASGSPDLDEAEEVEEASGVIKLQGRRVLPVIPVKFLDTGDDPFPSADLQEALFADKPGTLTDYYTEVSYKFLTVTGQVVPWQTLSQPGTHYEGADFRKGRKTFPCKGLCKNARIQELVKEALALADSLIDFRQMDQSGPDGIPDGFVDAVALVHPERGSECGPDENGQDESAHNIWSHQSTLAEPFVTADKREDGEPVRIKSFFIVPALSCRRPDAQQIEIGVFAHEFGHSLGLPDLYDTDETDGASDGVGNWCLMGTGAWGGDGRSPERPTHLSAWAKSHLGWIFPVKVASIPQFQPALVTNSETAFLAYKLPIDRNEYYLVENRQQIGYDVRLPGSGLLIWKINASTVKSGLATNRVNADEDRKGVELVQADNLNQLNEVRSEKADNGDIFPGSTDKRLFHNRSRPASLQKTAVCDISDPSLAMTATLLVTTGTCPEPPPAVAAAPARPAGESLQTTPLEITIPVDDPLTLREVAAEPEKYLNRRVRLAGYLTNRGKDLFTDTQIVLQDSEEHVIEVQPWLPLEAAPGPQGGMPALPTYLDKNVEIVGEVQRKALDARGEVLVLVVESAEVIPPQ